MSFTKAYKEILVFYLFVALFTCFLVWRIDRLNNISIKNSVVYVK